MTEQTADDTRQRASELLEILELERIEENLYRGRNETREGQRLFGGQVLAQALRAASATVPDRQPHSLRAYFMRAGDAARPVLYEVERIRDGRSFATRRVVAIQQGEAIFSSDVSFQAAEEGFEHAHPMPNVPPPEELEDDLAVASRLRPADAAGDTSAPLTAGSRSEASSVRPSRASLGRDRSYAMGGRARPFRMRSVVPLGSEDWHRDRFWNPVWIRFGTDLPGQDATLRRCLLAYASDMGMVSTAALPHASTQPRAGLQMASLDHALWIHRDVALDDWLLFHKRTSAAQGARGLVHAELFSRDGRLLASVSQEGLLRPLDGAAAADASAPGAAGPQ